MNKERFIKYLKAQIEQKNKYITHSLQESETNIKRNALEIADEYLLIATEECDKKEVLESILNLVQGGNFDE